MTITVKINQEINDLVLVAALVDKLAELAHDRAAATALKKQIVYRLTRLKKAEPVD
jgi:hypothetical protein